MYMICNNYASLDICCISSSFIDIGWFAMQNVKDITAGRPIPAQNPKLPTSKAEVFQR